jgi:hypothetical protein
MATLIVGENTYVTLAEADEYFDSFLYSDYWTQSDEDTKIKALITACDMLDNGFYWAGEKTDSDQLLEFPRTGEFGCGDTIDPNEVPKAIKNAQCLQAQYLIEYPNVLKPVSDVIKKEKLDVMEIEYFESNYRKQSWIYDIVKNRLRHCYGAPKPQKSITEIYYGQCIRN